MSDDIDKPDNKALEILKNKGGRPLTFSDPEKLKPFIKKYFKVTPFDELTVTGLALACGVNRKGLDRYLERDGFREIIEEAKTIIEHSYESSLRKSGRSGDIFALKNFGWKDEYENNTKVTGEVKTGINWITTGQVIQDKAVNVIDGKEVKSLPGGEENGEED
jgi:hypothetical protein